MAPPRSPATSAKRSRAPPNPSPHPPAADGSGLLLLAAHDGDLLRLKRLVRALDAGRGRPREAVEAASSEGVGALHFAARKGRLPVCRYLVEELGLDVDAVDDKALTPMVWAMFGGSADAVTYLLDHGANPVKGDNKGFTPLHHAAGKGDHEMVKLFLAKGISVDPYNKRVPGADTPLLVAITASQVDCVKLLVEAGVDVNDGLVTPLAAAANKGLTACLKCLLEAGADPNVPDPSGRMPIEVAAVKGTREDVEILFPVTSCIPTVDNWSIDGIMRHAKLVSMEHGEHSNVRRIVELKSLAVNSFKRNDYFFAATLYSVAMEHDPRDATLVSNRSLCWHRMGDGHKALLDALACREMRPDWPKACYRQGMALMLLKDYEGACDAFLDAAKLDPRSAEIEAALREALNSLKTSGGATKAI